MIFHCCVSLPDGIWWFPFRHRGTPKSSSIFVDGIFRSKLTIFGIPHDSGNPHGWGIIIIQKNEREWHTWEGMHKAHTHCPEI